MDPTVGQAPDPSAPPPPARGRKKGTACSRCRSQKIRCDDTTPCLNCSRVNQPCIRNNFANQQDAINHITQIETRLRALEDSLRRVAPEELEKAPIVSDSSFRVEALSREGGHTDARPDSPPWPIQHSDSGLANSEALLSNTPSNHVLRQSQSSPGVPSSVPYVASASPAASTQIEPSEPLAHEVGMLSLANSKESKYLGPSSGVPFARLIFSAIPQSQGLATSWTTPEGGHSANKPSQTQPFPEDWTSEVDLQHFVDAYFETHQPFYPFLDEDAVADRLERLYTKPAEAIQSLHMPKLSEVEATLSPAHMVQMFLVIALGARVLEVRLSTEFSSERYLATAMQRIGSLALHDSIEGLQIMLLLALASFYFEDGPNAWFLTSNIIASCLDLGFQRKWNVPSPRESRNHHQLLIHNNLRRGIFWSAYSLERTLAVVLGRPLTLRDEAIDVQFPGEVGPGDAMSPIVGDQFNGPQEANPGNKRARLSSSLYTVSQYSFRFDQITAEIKLMLHRVVNLPNRFPWPQDLDAWRRDIQSNCNTLLSNLKIELRRRSRRNMSDSAIRTLELKYHHCLQLLHRPSPAVPQPTLQSWKTCCESATATILLNSELHRFSKLSNGWLTAHTVFVSGITFLYCLWVKPEIKAETTLERFESIAGACISLLQYLAKTWSVAADSVLKLERLINVTSNSWKASQNSRNPELAAGQSLVSMSQSNGLQSRADNEGGEDATMGIDETNMLLMNDRNYQRFDFEPGQFFTELGDMSGWFDLDWLANADSIGQDAPYSFDPL